MIIYRSWQTVKKSKNDWQNDKYKNWDGWFLFGFIPIYIRRR